MSLKEGLNKGLGSVVDAVTSMFVSSTPKNQANPAPKAFTQSSAINAKYIDNIKSTLLSTSNNEDSLLLDCTCEDTIAAKILLKNICIAIATMEDNQQRLSCLAKLSKKANELAVLKSNLESLKAGMEQSKTLTVFSKTDHLKTISIIQESLVMADQLKQNRPQSNIK
jgi:hypothetical protein